MPINRALQSCGLSLGPEDIKVLNDAYENTLRALYLVDRNDPLTEIVAKKIVEIGQAAISDPQEISRTAIKALGLP
jgi:hypothetical protein